MAGDDRQDEMEGAPPPRKGKPDAGAPPGEAAYIRGGGDAPATEDPAAGGDGVRGDTARRLLDAGRALFARRGYEGATVRAITDRAGANLGAVTYHFGSKRELYHRVTEACIAPLGDRVAGTAEEPGTPLDRLERVVEVYFDYLEENPDLPQLLFQDISSGRRPPPPVVRTVQRVMGVLAELVEEGREDGSIREVDPLLAALSTVAQPVHLTLVSRLLEAAADLDIDEPATRERITGHAVGFVRGGLEAR